MIIFDIVDRLERKYCNALGIFYISMSCFAAVWNTVNLKAMVDKGFD